MPDTDDSKPDPSAARRGRLAARWNQSQASGPAAAEPAAGESEAPTHEESKEDAVRSAVIDPPAPSEQPAEPPKRQPRGTVAGKEKLQPYVAADVAERARNAWWRTRSHDDGYETFSDLIEAAIAEKVAELEARFNEGRPFDPRPRKKLSSGRPVGR